MLPSRWLQLQVIEARRVPEFSRSRKELKRASSKLVIGGCQRHLLKKSLNLLVDKVATFCMLCSNLNLSNLE
jgi:hypothetical protein